MDDDITSPYQGLDPRAYWRSGVAQRAPLDPGDIFQPRFPITRKTKIMTAGSCFAQHVGRTLREANFNVLDAEPLPKILERALPGQTPKDFGFNLYSARYGNVYTLRQMLQLLREAKGELKPAHPIWEKDGRFFDAFRPNVEPKGFDTKDELIAHREEHLAAIRKLLDQVDLLVFTMGLTETWECIEDGTVYPTAPGTIAGTYDPDIIRFKNLDFNENIKDFVEIRKIIKAHNPKAQFLVTVSPVPLTATATGRHVEMATIYSKSVLRAVAGTLYERFQDLDYFPSFEIITSQAARGAYYEPNLRSVSPQGVATAMRTFMTAHGVDGAAQTAKTPPKKKAQDIQSEAKKADVVCEEALLEAFAK